MDNRCNDGGSRNATVTKVMVWNNEKSRIPKAGPRMRMRSEGDRFAFKEIVQNVNTQPCTDRQAPITSTCVRNGANRIGNWGISPIKGNKQRHAVVQQKKITLMRVPDSQCFREPQSFELTIDCHFLSYMNKIVSHLWISEKQYVTLFTGHLDVEYRAATLNWILKMQDKLYMETPIFMVVVRMFDVLLNYVPIAEKQYRLVGLTLSWIAVKYHSTKTLKASKILGLCKPCYSKQQLLDMERKLLQFFNYKLNVDEPSLFAMYYLRVLLLPLNHQLSFCVNFLMETFAMSPNFSRYPSSKIAACAVYITLEHVHPTKSYYRRLSPYFGYYEPSELKDLQNVMLLQLKLLLNPKCDFASVYLKYRTSERKQASIFLMQLIFGQ